MAGILYLVATPIGNLEDMTFRAIRILKEADLIAAEDTRNSIKLLNHFDIHTPMTSYHEYNKIEKGRHLVEKLLEGSDIALITDAGTPGISDPGAELVRMCMDEGITVTSAPGACAAVTALILSGKDTRRFAFEAFLPTDKKERRALLDELKTRTASSVIYEAPHRLVRTLEELHSELGDRPITLCRELTKKHETIQEFTLSCALTYFRENEPRGEFVLVLGGRNPQELKEEQERSWEQMTIEEHVGMYMDQGLERKAAMKAAAADRGVSRRDIYAALLETGRARKGSDNG